MDILWGICGIIVVLGIAFIFSSDRKSINLRTVFGGLAILIFIGLLVLKFEPGRIALERFTEIVNGIIGYTNDGINFLFGGLFEAEGIGFVFAFQVLPIVIFVSSIVEIISF